jgi:hypothetical protein
VALLRCVSPALLNVMMRQLHHARAQKPMMIFFSVRLAARKDLAERSAATQKRFACTVCERSQKNAFRTEYLNEAAVLLPGRM